LGLALVIEAGRSGARDRPSLGCWRLAGEVPVAQGIGEGALRYLTGASAAPGWPGLPLDYLAGHRDERDPHSPASGAADARLDQPSGVPDEPHIPDAGPSSPSGRPALPAEADCAAAHAHAPLGSGGRGRS